MQTAEVTLIAKLATGQLTLREINQLKVGDVIPVAVPEMIPGEVDGVPVLEGRYGVINGRYALKLERFVAEDELRQTPPKNLEEVQDV